MSCELDIAVAIRCLTFRKIVTHVVYKIIYITIYIMNKF